MNEDELWDMSDEELEAAFKEAVASGESLDSVETEEEFVESEPLDEETDSDVELDEAQDTELDEDGPEQPEDDLEDSDHNASDESEEDSVEEEDSDDSEEAITSEDEEPSSDETDEAEEEPQPAQMYKFRANGKDYEFSSEEIVNQFPKIFGQAMDYTKKMQTIKPWRKTIDALESAQLSHNDVSLMIDVLKGDKDAITEVLKRTGTDTLDLDTEKDSSYVTKDYGRDDSALAIKDIVDDISRDAEYATTHSILSKEWDDRSWQAITQNPEMIRLLHTDVKSGMYETLRPMVEKLKVYDGGRQSDLDYYKEAAQQHFDRIAEQEAYERQQAERQARREAAEAEQARLAEVKAKSEQRIATKQASAKRKAAAPTKNVAAGRAVIDYLDDSDEAFDEWYKKLQDEN